MAAGKRGVLPLLLLLAVIAAGLTAALPGKDEFTPARQRMIDDIRARGVTAPRVLAALAAVPRHLFVPENARSEAYADTPLPIGAGQTISQPYIVAFMTSQLDVQPGDRVLEIGTGSGYQAAVLARMGAEVYSIEIVKLLGERAHRTLTELGFRDIHLRIGDGYQGWQSAAPFDGIIVTAAPPSIPDPLLRQLKTGGKMVIPVGGAYQDLWVITKRRDGGFDRKRVLPVLFVPMTGEAQRREPPG
jgi:protein-L-isoaspartate(D-aspartate) O-methyltransferase